MSLGWPISTEFVGKKKHLKILNDFVEWNNTQTISIILRLMPERFLG